MQVHGQKLGQQQLDLAAFDYTVYMVKPSVTVSTVIVFRPCDLRFFSRQDRTCPRQEHNWSLSRSEIVVGHKSMSETKRKLRNSKQTDLTEVSEGASVAMTLHICHHADSSVPLLGCVHSACENHQLTQVYDLNSCVGQNKLHGQSNICHHDLF